MKPISPIDVKNFFYVFNLFLIKMCFLTFYIFGRLKYLRIISYIDIIKRKYTKLSIHANIYLSICSSMTVFC